ncbi:hypothetical protein OROGR_032878 [Orobanche gracilis]
MYLGNYYLADGGYINGEGFLAPYRGTRYHLREWEGGTRAPTSKEEYFNMKHSQARNVIERYFGLLKKRWTILRSPSFYPVRIQGEWSYHVLCCIILLGHTWQWILRKTLQRVLKICLSGKSNQINFKLWMLLNQVMNGLSGVKI